MTRPKWTKLQRPTSFLWSLLSEQGQVSVSRQDKYPDCSMLSFRAEHKEGQGVSSMEHVIMVYGFFLFLFFLYFLQNQTLQRWASSQPTFGTCASQRTHKREPWRRSLGPQIIVRLWRQRWSPFCRLSPPFISAAVTLLCPISSWTTKGFNTYRIGKPQVSGPEPEWEEKWCLFLHLNTW